MEKWKDIQEYEGLYQISNYGRVKSLRDNKGNYREKIIKSHNDKDGYKIIRICKNKKTKTYKIHRLVAEAFLNNSNNLPEVNHKDENKQNNKVENLEWCSRIYNCNYGNRNKKISENHADFKDNKNPRARKVKCITTGEIFETVSEAAKYSETGRSSIAAQIRGKLRTAGKCPNTGEKLRWEYIEEGK